MPRLDGPGAPDRADDTRDGILVTGPIERDAGRAEIDAVERSREVVRVALAAHLPVRDHVDTRKLHVTDGDPGGIVLRLLEEGSGTRQSSRARTRGGSRSPSRSRSMSHSGCG